MVRPDDRPHAQAPGGVIFPRAPSVVTPAVVPKAAGASRADFQRNGAA